MDPCRDGPNRALTVFRPLVPAWVVRRQQRVYTRAERVAALAISAVVTVVGIVVLPGGTWGLPLALLIGQGVGAGVEMVMYHARARAAAPP